MGAIALMPLPGAEAVDLEHIALQLELSLHPGTNTIRGRSSTSCADCCQATPSASWE
jgi:hypothetical protein